MDITQIAVAVIGLCVALISAFVVPWIKKKIGYEKLAKALEYVDVFVAAAEQVIPPEKYEEKKSYVVSQMNSKLDELGVKIDMITLDAEIESAVLKLHNELKTE